MDHIQKKSPLIFYLLGGIAILGIAYSSLQYVVFSQRYQQNFLETTSAFENRFKNTLDNYNLVLSEFAKEIKKKNLFSEPDKLTELFKKGYTYGLESTKGEKLHLSAINWVDKKGGPVIGQFGNLLYPLSFNTEYLEKLKRNPGKLEISNNIPNINSPEFSLTNLGIGVDDDKEVYRGFVNVRVPTLALFEGMIADTSEPAVHVILLDQNAQVLESSLGLTAEEKQAVGESAKKRSGKPFSKVSIIFTKIVPIEKSPYFLMFGYSARIFYTEFIAYLWPQLLCFLLCCLSLAGFSYFYHLRRLKQGWRVFRKKIESLQSTAYKMQEQYVQVSEKRKIAEEELKSKIDATREEKKLYLKVNKRISEAISDLLYVGHALLERVQDQEVVEDNPQKVMDIFETAYFHSCFTCIKNAEESVDVLDILDKSLKIHSNRIMESQIVVRRKIPKTLKSVMTDSLSFQQILVNVLGRAIKNVPTEGEIDIHVFEKKENLCIDFRDNGFAAENLSKNKDTRSLDSLSLEWNDLQKLVRSLGGTLSYRNTPYQGNYFALLLPFQFHKTYPLKETGTSFLADNVIPFSTLKRNEKT